MASDIDAALAKLSQCDKLELLSLISSFQTVPTNLQKTSMLEFAAACVLGSDIHGNTVVQQSAVDELLSSAGSSFKHGVENANADPLVIAFTGMHEFMRGVGSPLQNIEGTIRRFSEHEPFIRSRLGFGVKEALSFATRIIDGIMYKMSDIKQPPPVLLTKQQYYDFAYYVQPPQDLIRAWSKAIRFSRGEYLEPIPSELHEAASRYLDTMTLEVSNPISFDKLNTLCPNPLWERPVVRTADQYAVPFPFYLIQNLSRRLHRELVRHSEYVGTYVASKGKVAETWVADLMKRLVPSEQIHKNVRYDKSHGYPDADVIVESGKYLIFFECTTKLLSEKTMQGDLDAIRSNLDASIRKCYNQAQRAIRAFNEGNLQVDLRGNPQKFITVIVTDGLYPNLTLDMQRGTYVRDVVRGGPYPYIVSLFDLDQITEAVDIDLFVRFLNERISMSETPFIVCMDEADYLNLFLKPEYEEIKKMTVAREITMNYVGHGEIPRQISTLEMFKRIINEDKFALIKVHADSTDKAVKTVMSVLYSIYVDWDVVLKHMVFGLKDYRCLVESYKNRGTKCKLLGWEGMEETLRWFSGEEGKRFWSDLEARGLDEVNLVVTCDTDMYKEVYKELLGKGRGNLGISSAS